jgi:Na+(H+)/acetate symporter ActP
VRLLRVLAGLVIGTFVGLAVILLVVLAKPPFLVDTPRSEHPALLVVLVAVPALIGALVGLVFAVRRER